jgi:HEPN domain-containing protein
MINGILREPLRKTLFYLARTDWYGNYWHDCLDQIKNRLFDKQGEGSIIAFGVDPQVEFLIEYFENYLLLGNFIGADRLVLEEIRDFITYLKNPGLFDSKDRFESAMSSLNAAMARISPLIYSKLNKLSLQEIERLDEARVAFSNCCYFSCTIMSVSAVESRLHSKVKETDEDIYREHFESKTLGQLLQIFNKKDLNRNYDKIKMLMPEKYYPLIQLLNQYRILSAHPKNVGIEPHIAESILNLSFAFLTDS